MATRKTTLMLSEDVIEGYKIEAAKAGRSLSRVIDEALRAVRQKTPDSRPERWALPTLGGGHPLPDIDWSSNAAIEEFLEGDLPLDKQR